MSKIIRETFNDEKFHLRALDSGRSQEGVFNVRESHGDFVLVIIQNLVLETK